MLNEITSHKQDILGDPSFLRDIEQSDLETEDSLVPAGAGGGGMGSQCLIGTVSVVHDEEF